MTSAPSSGLAEYATSQDTEGLAELLEHLGQDVDKLSVKDPASVLQDTRVADFGPVTDAAAEEVLALLTHQFGAAWR